MHVNLQKTTRIQHKMIKYIYFVKLGSPVILCRISLNYVTFTMYQYLFLFRADTSINKITNCTKLMYNTEQRNVLLIVT